jgi:tetratricopeptide (TPR) repeat protein
MKIFRPFFIALALVGSVRPALAQVGDPKAAFVDSLGRFSTARDRPSIDAMARALAQWDAAIRASEAQFVSSLPGSSSLVAARMHTALGAAYLDRRRVTDAIRELDAAAHLDPARVDAVTFHAVAYDQLLGDFDRASAAYRQAAALDPLNASRAYLLARALAKAGKHDEALDAYRTVVRLWQRDISEHTPIGIDRPFIQLALVEERPGIEPFFPSSKYAEGFDLLRRGDYGGAVEAFRRAADDPERKDAEAAGAAHYKLARTYHRENKTLEALSEYDAAEKAKPFVGGARVLQQIGTLQAAQQNFDAALQADSARVDADVNDADAHRTLGYLYSRLDRADEAFAEFAIALTIAPGSPDIHVAMSQMHLKQGDYRAAADAARRAIRLNPGNKQAHYSLATALMRLDKPEDARPEFDMFERLQAEDTANAAQDMKINGLRRALEADPDNPELRRQLAEAEAVRRR